MPERHTQVLVVGGSLVGLSTSVLLANYGVPHLLVESHPGTAIHPRAASFHQRTMEVFRSVGLQREVEDAAAGEFRQGGAIVAVESRSEEHTSELQSRENLVCRLLLEKKKNNKNKHIITIKKNKQNA